MKFWWLTPLCASLALAEEPSPLPWAGSISGIEATNAVAPGAEPSDDVLTALKSLQTPDASVTSAYTELAPRIYSIEPTEDSSISAEERVERAKVLKAIQEADAAYRSGNADASINAMTQLLPSVKFAIPQAQILNRLGYWFFRKGDYTQAIHYLERARTVGTLDAMAACNLSAALMTSGRAEEAEKILAAIKVAAIRNPVLLYSIYFNSACAKALMGKPADALAFLARAAQTDPISTYTSLGDPQLDGLRSDLRFQSLRAALEQYHNERTRPKKDSD